jgi:hypothetical protein
MPIRPDLRWYQPIDWKQISAAIRFDRARGRCEQCARPHGATITRVPDGVWFDPVAATWRDDRGREAPWPDIEAYAQRRAWRVVLAAAHLDHDPSNSRPRNLKAFCQRCHLIHDRAEHARRRRVTILSRRARGDLFLGAYNYTIWQGAAPARVRPSAAKGAPFGPLRAGGRAGIMPQMMR